MIGEDTEDFGVVRRHFVAIATSDYDDPGFAPLAVGGEVRAIREWLCSPVLGERAFTPAHPQLADNPTQQEITEALKNPEASVRWREGDAAVVFVTGHGETEDGVHWSVLKASERDRLAATALRTADLILWLKTTKIRYLFLVLDLCFGGRTITDVAAFERDLPGTWLVLPSATRDQEATVGALTNAVTAFLAELATRDGGSYAGEEIAHLDVQLFLQGIRGHLGRGQRLELLQGSQSSGPHPCLPNPHYRPRGRDDVRPALADMVPPLSGPAGYEEAGPGGGPGAAEVFTGRRRVMLDLHSAAVGVPAATVVTGSAGSGKSAVLSRLVSLSDPAFRHHHRERLENIPTELRLVEGTVDVAVVATGKTPVEIIAQIAVALGVPAPAARFGVASLNDWIAAWQNWLSTGQEPITVVVDALDEASGPRAVLTGVLAALDPEWTRVRLLVGVRSTAAGGEDEDVEPAADPPRAVALADRVEQVLAAHRIQVDASPWWEASDLADYAATVLTSPANSPYTHPDSTRTLADALAERAGTSFLVTLIAATNLAARAERVPATDHAWLGAVDDGITGVLRQDLDTHCGDDPEQRIRTVHLLRAVAFGRGRGILWRRVWPAVASAVADDPDRVYGDRDIGDLLASPFAGYLTTDTSDGTTVYRLFHAALDSALRSHWADLLAPDTPRADTGDGPDEEKRTEKRITARLLAVAEEALTHEPPDVPGYIRRHLVEHAASADVLDRRILRPDLLPHLDSGRLRDAAQGREPDASPGLWDAFLRATHQWDFDRPARNAAELELQAASLGTPLGKPTSRDGWRVLWTTPFLLGAEILGVHTDLVRAVAVLEHPDGRHTVVTGGDDCTVRRWDLATGQPTGRPLIGHTSDVRAVATVLTAEGRALAVSCGLDRVIQVWDLDSGQPVGGHLRGHQDMAHAVACLLIDGRPRAVTGGFDRTVRVWDLESGEQIGAPLTGHQGMVWAVSALVTPDGRAIAVTGDSNGVVIVWDVREGCQLGVPLRAHAEAVGAVSAFVLDGRLLAVTGSHDHTVRLWDLDARQPFGDPLIGHTGWVRAVSALVLPDDRALVASCGDDKVVRFWDVRAGREVIGPRTAYGHTAYAVATTLRRGGAAVAVAGYGDRTVRTWPLPTEESDDDYAGVHGTPVYAVATANIDGRDLVVTGGGDGVVRIRDLGTGGQLGEPLTMCAGRVWALSALVVPDGRTLLVTGDERGTVTTWDLSSRQRVAEPGPSHSAPAYGMTTVVRGDQALAFTSDAFGSLLYWDVLTGRPIAEPKTVHRTWVRDVSVLNLPDGRALVVTTSYDHDAKVWDLDDPDASGAPLSGHTDQVNAVTTLLVPDGRALAVTVSHDCTVRVWDLNTLQPVGPPLTHHDKAVNTVSALVLPDGRALAVTGGNDGTVRVWDLITLQPVGEPLTVRTAVRSLALTEAGHHPPLVVIGTDHGIATARLPIEPDTRVGLGGP